MTGTVLTKTVSLRASVAGRSIFVKNRGSEYRRRGIPGARRQSRERSLFAGSRVTIRPRSLRSARNNALSGVGGLRAKKEFDRRPDSYPTGRGGRPSPYPHFTKWS